MILWVTANEPVDPRVRLAIARWPDDAPRGAVTLFCADHNISRKTFYVLRGRAREDGEAAVLEPRSRRPRSSPTRISDDTKDEAIQVRAALEASGLDHGPISVFDKMRTMGLEAPSIASLGRIFREAGVARAEPNKKPRSAFRRFTYPAPNACWQMDGTEAGLTRGRKCVIFQLEDDHSRFEVASHVAATENSQAAIHTLTKGIQACGVPQRLLTDNGLALNPSRRGWTSKLVAYATSLGIQTIAGKPYKPTTQGKNERLHRTLFRWLDKRPLPESIADMQALVDEFDHIYNTQRPHQALPDRMTPKQAWDATPVAVAPEPPPTTTGPTIRLGDYGNRACKINSDGIVSILGIRFAITSTMAGQTIQAVWDPLGITFTDTNGEILIKHPWPPKGTRYVSNGIPRGRPRSH